MQSFCVYLLVMWACMHVFVYIQCTHTYIHTYTHACMHTYTHTPMHIHACMITVHACTCYLKAYFLLTSHAHASTHTHTHTNTPMNIHVLHDNHACMHILFESIFSSHITCTRFYIYIHVWARESYILQQQARSCMCMYGRHAYTYVTTRTHVTSAIPKFQ
jgi:hypothetical protein